MKKYIALFVLAMCCLMPAVAQQQKDGNHPRFNIEDFKANMKSFIRERACLTQAEADKVFPIFFEMKTKQMELTRQIGGLKMEAFRKTEAKECEAILKQITALDVQSAKLEQNYYSKIAKEVGAKKAINIMFADDAFHRDILRRATPQGQMGQPGQNRGQGRNRGDGRGFNR